MSAATDLVTAVTPAAGISTKDDAVIQGILNAIQAIITTPGADLAACLVKLNAFMTDFNAQKANLVAASTANTPLQLPVGVRPLVF